MNGPHYKYFSADITFCHDVEGAHDIKCSEKYLELKFC